MWLGVTAFGMWHMMAYDFQPGASGIPQATRDGSNGVHPRAATLCVYLHPQCECSHATLDGLKSLIKSHAGAIETDLYFYEPSGYPKDWAHGSLWHDAVQIPGAHLVEDLDGAEAKRHGAYTSGTVQLYDAHSGELIFSGGVTPGRGQYGESRGLNSIEDYFAGKKGTRSSPVYGCAIIPSGV